MLVKVGLSLLLLAGCGPADDGPFDFVVVDRWNALLLRVHYDSYAGALDATHTVLVEGTTVVVTVGGCRERSCVGTLIEEAVAVTGTDPSGRKTIGLFCTGTEGFYGEALDPQVSGACTP